MSIKRSLYQTLAERLSGREIRIIWQRPDKPGKTGQFVAADGQPTIYIDPDLSDRNTYRVILHEIAHSLQEQLYPKPKGQAVKPIPWKPEIRERLRKRRILDLETEADNQAREWELQAERMARQKGLEGLTGQILALLVWG